MKKITKTIFMLSTSLSIGLSSFVSSCTYSSKDITGENKIDKNQNFKSDPQSPKPKESNKITDDKVDEAEDINTLLSKTENFYLDLSENKGLDFNDNYLLLAINIDEKVFGNTFKNLKTIIFNFGTNELFGEMVDRFPELNNNKEFLFNCLKRNTISSNKINDSQLLLDNKEEALKIIKDYGRALYYASESLKNDKEVVLEAVKSNGRALQYASKSLRNDKDVVLEAVKSNGHALYYAPEQFENDKDVVLEAVKSNGGALQYASESLKNDKDVVLEAVKSDGGALYLAPEQFKNNKDVVLEAVKSDGRALYYAPEQFKNDKDVVLEAVKSDGDVLKYASESLEKDEEVILNIGELSIFKYYDDYQG